jgi:hypothetical protein
MQPDYITLKEYAARIGRPIGSVYQDSRLNKILGMVRFGKLIRIHWTTHQKLKAEEMVVRNQN